MYLDPVAVKVEVGAYSLSRKSRRKDHGYGTYRQDHDNPQLAVDGDIQIFEHLDPLVHLLRAIDARRRCFLVTQFVS